jgi:transcriptional regulator with XRE-family HTH domain
MEQRFGEILRDLRLRSGVGLRELARRIGKSPGYISDVENGRVPPPSEAVIVQMASVLGVDGDGLLGAAKKVDPKLSRYLAEQPKAADFLRWARDKHYDKDDFERLTQMAKAARLGKEENDA